MRPDLGERLDQPVDVAIRMHRRGRHAQAFGADGHGRVVDRLHIDPVIVHQPVADHLALLGVPNHHRDDVARIVQVRDAHDVERPAHLHHALLLKFALLARNLEVADARCCARCNRRRQGGREDEAARKAAHEIDEVGRGRDIAAHHAERLAERAFDHGDAVHQPFALSNPAAARAVEADRVDFVDIAHRAVLLAHVEDLGDGSDIAVHRIDAFEGDQLGHFGAVLRQELVEMRHVIVAEHLVGRAAVADAFDHRGVIERVGKHHAARDLTRQRAKARPVRDIAASEQQRGFLVVEVSQLALEQHVVVVGARDVARAARARAAFVEAIMHRFEHRGVLAHAEIVVRAPHGDGLRFLIDEARRVRELAAVALDIGEDPIPSVSAHSVQLAGEIGFEIHGFSLCFHDYVLNSRISARQRAWAGPSPTAFRHGTAGPGTGVRARRGGSA